MSSSRFDAEIAALAAGVGGLEHGREADLVGRPPPLGDRAHGREARLRDARVGEACGASRPCASSGARVDADARQPARLGDGRDDRHGPVGAHGHHAVDVQAAPRLQHRVRRRRSRRPSRCRPRRGPGASGLRSTAATRNPIAFAWRIARRWWRPAPTKRTVLTGDRSYFGARADRISSSVPSTSTGKPAPSCTASPSRTTPRNRPTVSSDRSEASSPLCCRWLSCSADRLAQLGVPLEPLLPAFRIAAEEAGSLRGTRRPSPAIPRRHAARPPRSPARARAGPRAPGRPWRAHRKAPISTGSS